MFTHTTSAEDPYPDTDEGIGAGMKMLLEDGADGGSTLEGDFTRTHPESATPAAITGVSS